MKKVLFLALAAAAVMSCSESEEIENAGQKAEIKLGTVVGNTTRATVTDLPELQKMPHSGKLWQQFQWRRGAVPHKRLHHTAPYAMEHSNGCRELRKKPHPVHFPLLATGD